MIETLPRIDKLKFRNFEFYLLRDDLLGEFNGNKARKLHYFLNKDLSGFKKIVSNGSSQSNAMYSISLFAKIKGLEFEYVMSHISKNLEQNTIGNFKFALGNGMKYYINQNRVEFAKGLCDEKSIFINEGVAQPEAEMGFKNQALEIEKFAKHNGLEFDIFLPSGTGASATYLAKHSRFKVYTTPCVGDVEYLKKQISNLDKNSNLNILKPPKKYHFGNLKKELYDIYKELLDETGVEFDLIYDPVGFLTLFANLDKFQNKVLYIHQGGILGNISQLERYKFKGMIC
ncbi:1-aminocyclopropane-1-carboxylate deaminase [Campylobacter blaseri]|uniref:1-aminocyclopropane-1-carboxylate deaminase n=1 Tax=Campylobacter blaseri TaxID=2042961 RepID=A0A2P8R257_9BACT|nr:1-aminocyclopropane-1-carboxylate deaminase [Campylobacter blaseri]PSM52585.1 1-aminocyclopropane-1-carboxylate deaminase [Campylobacter blaseri]PSM54233.1 1-aminocyclopropane-1-carboxylate deaminase [Campylobacter blaseri]QKF85884.1 1-aminocyclopropane-1-carboxylate deaminase [Campylobacter blaseri]